MRKTIYSILLPLLALVMAQPAQAQKSVTEYDLPVIVPMTSARTISPSKHTAYIRVSANVGYEASSDAEWLAVGKNSQGIYYTAETNTEILPRTANITLTNAENKLSRVIKITQERDNTVDKIVIPTGIKPTSVTANVSTSNTYKIENTIDGNINTMFRCSPDTGKFNEENPLVLTYYFNGESIDDVTYETRPYYTGVIGYMKIYYKLKGQDEFTYLYTSDLTASVGSTSGISVNLPLGENGLDNVEAIKFEAWNGYKSGNAEYFQCGEMTFGRSITKSGDYSVFADKLLTTLKPEVTQEDIDNISDPFVANLAQKIFDGDYSTDYRVGNYPCRYDPSLVERDLVTSGAYDIFEGVTGVMLTPGKNAVVVDGIPAGAQAKLTICSWTVPEKSYPKYYHYPLKNGVNVITHTYDSCGMAYVTYVSDTPEKNSPIGVHLVNGKVQGYMSNKLTNDEMQTMLENAPYTVIDLMGDRVHLTFEVKSLLKYTKGEYRRLINIYDSVIFWTHRLIGLEKYDHVPANRTLFYVNYDYFMYKTGLGASAKYDVTDILVPANFTGATKSTMWGVAHEWGHQHQLRPYFNWAGLGEVSNNMHSCYSCLYMGCSTSNMTREFGQGYKDYLQGKHPKEGKASKFRHLGYQAANRFSYSPKMQQAYLAMADSVIKPIATDSLHAATYNEGELGNRLASFFQIYDWYMLQGNTDVYPDLYESLRHTATDEDKYALAAAAQNNVSGRYNILAEKYPESCWVTDKYIKATGSSTWDNQVPYIMNFIWKISTVTGYNWFRYFELWGYLRQVAMNINDDYGTKYYCMTKEMYDEFKADMDARVESGELKEMSDAMIHEIASLPIPKIAKNKQIPN